MQIQNLYLKKRAGAEIGDARGDRLVLRNLATGEIIFDSDKQPGNFNIDIPENTPFKLEKYNNSIEQYSLYILEQIYESTVIETTTEDGVVTAHKETTLPTESVPGEEREFEDKTSEKIKIRRIKEECDCKEEGAIMGPPVKVEK